MGYTTFFHGEVAVEPPLNEAERDYLHDFSGSRRMKTTGGPYLASPGDDAGQDREHIERLASPVTGAAVRIIDYNEPADGQPGLWCQWVPTEDGAGITWDGGEKFYHGEEWMKYLIDHFLKPGARAKGHPGFELFTFDHTVNGYIAAEGEDPDDRWMLIVRDNVVRVAASLPTAFGEEREV